MANYTIPFDIDLSSASTQEPQEKFGNIYKAKSINSSGISPDGDIIFGLTLVCVSEGNYYDVIEEQMDDLGTDAWFIPPEEGLVEGAYYEGRMVCTSTDWETGYCDDTEVYIYRVL